MTGGCWNQDVASNEVQQFFTESQVQDLHQTFNGLDVKELEHTHSRWTKRTHQVTATPSMRKHIEGSRLFERKMR